MFNKEDKVSRIRRLVSRQKVEDSYILDDEDAIIVVHSDDETGYIMIHERLVNGKLVVINRWPLSIYYFGSIHEITPIRELNLFQVQNNGGRFNSLYDYKKGKFIVPQNTWNIVDSGRDNSYLEKYKGFLASFSISADYEKDDLIAYTNPITDAKIVETFGARDGIYYAIIDFDGTIRGNALFKGDSFSKITSIINLSEYGSLEAFKEKRKQVCNEIKAQRKREYFKRIEGRDDGSISPYLDSEVAKIIKFNKMNEAK